MNKQSLSPPFLNINSTPPFKRGKGLYFSQETCPGHFDHFCSLRFLILLLISYTWSCSHPHHFSVGFFYRLVFHYFLGNCFGSSALFLKTDSGGLHQDGQLVEPLHLLLSDTLYANINITEKGSKLERYLQSVLHQLYCSSDRDFSALPQDGFVSLKTHPRVPGVALHYHDPLSSTH